jgi:hypothetical protein
MKHIAQLELPCLCQFYFKAISEKFNNDLWFTAEQQLCQLQPLCKASNHLDFKYWKSNILTLRQLMARGDSCVDYQTHLTSWQICIPHTGRPNTCNQDTIHEIHIYALYIRNRMQTTIKKHILSFLCVYF